MGSLQELQALVIFVDVFEFGKLPRSRDTVKPDWNRPPCANCLCQHEHRLLRPGPRGRHGKDHVDTRIPVTQKARSRIRQLIDHRSIRPILQAEKKFAKFRAPGIEYRMAILVVSQVHTTGRLNVECISLPPPTRNPRGIYLGHCITVPIARSNSARLLASGEIEQSGEE